MSAHRDLIVVDVETTGPNPFVHDLLAVALVPMVADIEPLVVHTRFPHLEWSDFGRANFEKFGRDWERLAVDPIEAVSRIERFVQRVVAGKMATLVGHNVGFDLSFLKKLAFACGKSEIQGVSHRSIDTHTLLYLAWLQGRVRSTALTSDGAFDAFDIPGIQNRRHTALGDALATKELFLRLIDTLDETPLSSPRQSAK